MKINYKCVYFTWNNRKKYLFPLNHTYWSNQQKLRSIFKCQCSKALKVCRLLLFVQMSNIWVGTISCVTSQVFILIIIYYLFANKKKLVYNPPKWSRASKIFKSESVRQFSIADYRKKTTTNKRKKSWSWRTTLEIHSFTGRL